MGNDFEENWATQVRKGVIELCVLNALNGGRLYGYDIVRRLRELDGLVIAEGTVYPLLSRLKREKFVRTRLEESPHGPARKYYELTELGRRQLASMNDSWRRIAEGVAELQRKERNDDVEQRSTPASGTVSRGDAVVDARLRERRRG